MLVGAGSVLVGGVRVAGISGIYNHRNFRRPRNERLPFDADAIRSVYHQRSGSEFMMRCLAGRRHDIFIR